MRSCGGLSLASGNLNSIRHCISYHLSVVSISRGAGRSAAGACAYIAADVAVDDYTGTRLDYTRKAKPVGVGYFGSDANTPQNFAHSLDSKETRKNSMVAREIVVALPHSAKAPDRIAIVAAIARELVTRYGAPVMVAIHKPDKKGDARNHHAHIIMGTRDKAGKKLRMLDTKDTAAVEIAHLREFVSKEISNRVAPDERSKWSHLSHAARGISRPPMRHEGPMLTGMRRKAGLSILTNAKYNDAVRSVEPLEAFAAQAFHAAEDTCRELEVAQVAEATVRNRIIAAGESAAAALVRRNMLAKYFRARAKSHFQIQQFKNQNKGTKL